MRFDEKLMNYAIREELTVRKLLNCRRLIEKQAEKFGGGFTVLQAITLKSILKTMKTRIEHDKPELLETFNYYFSDIIGFNIAK